MQNIIILIITVACAILIGRRFYRNLKNSGGSCECGCSCTQCGPDTASSCRDKSPETK